MYHPYQSIEPDNIHENTTPTAAPEEGWTRVEAAAPETGEQTVPPDDAYAPPAASGPPVYEPWSVTPQPYVPAARTRKSRRPAAVAGLAAACLVFSVAAGFGGGYLAAQVGDASGSSGSSGGKPVIYQSVANTGDTGSLSVADVAAKAAGSVVEIKTESITNSFYGQKVSESAGSGVIITADGYIVTNNHVIAGASTITVRTRDGSSYNAKLVGTDPQTDLAVLKIDAADLTPAVLGDSEKLVVGETAVAIGNPLGELGGTVTSGIISALSREISTTDGVTMNLLQTNAAINPGNSGGGLFNSSGELIGIVNAKSIGDGIEGLGFAIPMHTAKPVIEDLISKGYVTGRVDTGFTPLDLTSQEEAMRYGVRQTGVYVYSVTDSDCGLQSGDLLLAIDGKEIASMSDYNTAIQGHSVGDTLTVVVLRSNRQTSVALTLKEAGGGSTSGNAA